MKNFNLNYTLTDLADPIVPSVASIFEREKIADLAAGAYNNGLLMVLNHTSDSEFLKNWAWLIGPKKLALFATAFGDVFYWHPDENRICFLGVQYGEIEPVSSDISWFLNEFLLSNDVVRDVLRRERFEELIKIHGPLKYDQAFILQPWLFLGGEDRVEKYSTGKRSVLVDLLGQALAQR